MFIAAQTVSRDVILIHGRDKTVHGHYTAGTGRQGVAHHLLL